ncbi:hypothetical protein SSX86_005462 [Deinandra increscens subsp. villosa]|uniref:Glycine-rich RNA-binding protein n=1 Tax=Deinandra increscens subsp. villosa TaxID=3103831 RepID=A0AAP0DL85_9ASTR
MVIPGHPQKTPLSPKHIQQRYIDRAGIFLQVLSFVRQINANFWKFSRSHHSAALNMSDDVEYRCFIGGLSWSTSDRALKDAFSKYGRLLDAKVVLDKVSGRSRGFGFVTYDDKQAMEDAIEAMNGIDLDGRNITVDKAQPQGGSGRDYDGGRDRDRDRGRDRGRDRDYGGGRGGGGGGGDCFKCGKPGHFARECPSEGGDRRGGGGRDDRYGGGGRGGGGGGSRYGPDRNGDRYSGRSRDGGGGGGGGGGDRYSRDRSGPYERRSGGFR